MLKLPGCACGRRPTSAVGSYELVDDLAVGEEHRTVGVRRGHRVVGDHHDRLAELAHGLTHEVEDLGARAGVEVAGGLVGEDDLGPAGERPGDGDALLLATRELGRPVRRGATRGRRSRRRCRARPCRACWPASRIGSVMFSAAVSVGMRLYAWKTKPTRSRRSFVSFFSLSLARSVSPMYTAPEVRVSRPASACISVDLPEPDGPMIAVKRPRGEVDADSVEGTDLGLTLAVDLVASTARAATRRGAVSGRGMGRCGGVREALSCLSTMRSIRRRGSSAGRRFRRAPPGGTFAHGRRRGRVHLGMYARVVREVDAASAGPSVP